MAMLIVELRKAMLALSPTYRWLATSLAATISPTSTDACTRRAAIPVARAARSIARMARDDG
jgi:hypothetical protein